MKLKQELGLALSSIQHLVPAEKIRHPEIYAEWLAQTYFFVRHSTQLLGYALPFLKNTELKRRFEKHMGEEDRHDVMLLKDLEKMGRNISEFSEWSLTQAFYQSQYYRIQFEGGTAILGYILFLEGLAAGWGHDLYMEMKPVFPNSVLFARVHAEEDPSHVGEAIKAIESLPSEEQQIILNNLQYSMEIYQKMLIRMVELRYNKKAA